MSHDQESKPAEGVNEVRNHAGGSIAGQVVQAGTITGDVHLHARAGTSPLPRQLPASPREFVGRAEELAALTTALDEAAGAGGTVVISAIKGVGGMGKTWLTLYWAHRHLERFPDGQLYVNLRGFDPAARPLRPEAAVRGFLDAFEIDPARIPSDPEAQAGLYRSLVAGRHMLIVLDNAVSTEQVLPLLPGAASCTVIVTSRNQLTSLVTAHEARALSLDALTEAEARDLLVGRVGSDRAAAEPEAVRDLLASCAGLPLALSIAAARTAASSSMPLSTLAAELRDAPDPLGVLDGGDPRSNLATVFSWSYAKLSSEAAEPFCLLGLAPGSDISLTAASSLMGQSTDHAGKYLRELDRASLVQQSAPDRWKIHDLVKHYAANRARHDLPGDVGDAALRRLIDFYVHTAHAADRLINPRRPPIELDPCSAGCLSPPLTDQASAWTWFKTERPCILAAQKLAAARGWHMRVWELAWGLDTFQYRRGYLYDRIRTLHAGLLAAQEASNPPAVFMAHRLLGHAYVRIGNPTEALDHLQRALAMAEDAGNVLDQAHTHSFLVKAWAETGDDRRAFSHATSAQRLFHELGHPIWEAQVLIAMGRYSARLGYHGQAHAHCETALTLCRQHHDRQGETEVLDSLGHLAYLAGRYQQALDYYRQALTLFRELGHMYYQADTLDRLGHVHLALDNSQDARNCWQQALHLFQNQHRTADVERIQRQLDESFERKGIVARKTDV